MEFISKCNVACRHILPNPLLNFKTTGLFASSIDYVLANIKFFSENKFSVRHNVVTAMLIPLYNEYKLRVVSLI